MHTGSNYARSFFNNCYILCALFRKLDGQEPHIFHPHFDPGECYSTGTLYKYKLSQKNLASVTVTRLPKGQMLNRWLSEKAIQVSSGWDFEELKGLFCIL